MKTFLYQINTTRDCNLRCTHCYISSDKKAQSQSMTQEQFLTSFRELAKFLNTRFALDRYQVAEVHVIGGEPTTLGRAFYDQAMPLVREILSGVRQQVKLSIVTNLLTDDAVHIAKLFDFVCTSYEVETRFISVGGRDLPKLEQIWNKHCATLRADGIQLNVTTAVTAQAVAKTAPALLDDLFSRGFRQMHLGFFIPSGDGRVYKDSVFPPFEDTSQFMIDAMTWYLERRDEYPDLYVNPMESMIEAIHEDEPFDDIVCPIIPGSIDVDWNGETVTCIEAGGEVDMTSLGNLFEVGLSEIINSPEYRREQSKAILPKPACVDCEELTVCQSACGVLHEHWDGTGECPGYKRFITHVRSLVHEQGIKPKNQSAWRAC